MSDKSFGLLDGWLQNIKRVYEANRAEIDALPGPDERANRLAEYNVKQQVLNISKTATIQTAWKNSHLPQIHGWIYDLKDGLLKQVYKVIKPAEHKQPELVL